MCIRDREHTVHQAIGAVVQAQVLANYGDQHAEYDAIEIVAVSYTHLTLPTSDLV